MQITLFVLGHDVIGANTLKGNFMLLLLFFVSFSFPFRYLCSFLLLFLCVIVDFCQYLYLLWSMLCYIFILFIFLSCSSYLFFTSMCILCDRFFFVSVCIWCVPYYFCYVFLTGLYINLSDKKSCFL